MADKSIADQFNEALAGVTDETLKASLSSAFKKVNTERGEFGQRLIQKDQENKTLEEEKKSYGEAYATLKKHGVSPEDIPKILEKMNIVKTVEEEYEITKVALKTESAAKKELADKVRRLEAEKALSARFEKARNELKDEKGQPVKLAEKFINFNELYDVQDLGNETVLSEKINKVLTEAVSEQTKVIREIGFQGNPTHKTQVPGTPPVIVGLPIQEVMKKHGADAAIATWRRMRDNQQG